MRSLYVKALWGLSCARQTLLSVVEATEEGVVVTERGVSSECDHQA